MKFGKKLLATVIVAIMVMALAMVSPSAADYTVKPGGTVSVDLSIYNTEGVQGNISCEGNASVSYSSQGGGVQGNGDVAIFNDGVKGTITITANLTAPSNATPGSTTYTVEFHYRESINNGDDMSDWKTLTRTVEVVSGGSSGGNSSNNGGGSSGGSSSGSGSSSSGSEVKVDLSKLLEAIEKAKDLGKDNETNSLWLALLDALTNGNLMLGSDDQAQVDAAAKQINDLIEQLAGGNGKFCNISIHKVWPILFFISLAANVVLVVVLVKKNGTKKKNQVDNTPLVDYDISDDE